MIRLLILVGCVASYINGESDNACQSLDGQWYNQHGSEMLLELDQESLTGEFRTAVEQSFGSAGYSFSKVKGFQTIRRNRNTVAFSVLFKQGKSVASWLGQCLKCNGKDLLRTTWLLLASQQTFSNHWKSTLIGQDVFTRHTEVDGPRKHLETHRPKISQKLEEEIVDENSIVVQSVPSIQGKWFSKNGIEMTLSVDSTIGTINGTYKVQGTESIPLIGHLEPNSTTGTFSIFVSVPNFEKDQICVGQYYKGDDRNEVLETSWLHHDDEDFSCEGGDVKFSRVSFFKTQPRKDPFGANASVFSNMATKISAFFANLFG